MSSRTSTLGILLRHAGSNRSSSILLALLVGIAVLALSIAPRALVLLADSELAAQLAHLSPLESDVSVTGNTGQLYIRDERATGEELFGETDATLVRYPETLRAPFGLLLGTPQWVASFPSETVVPREPVTDVQSSFTLAFDLHWLDRVRFVEGTEPAGWDDTLNRDVPPNELDPLEAALSTAGAKSTGLSVGDVVDSDTVPYRVSGIYEAVDPADPYWLHADNFLEEASGVTLSGITIASAEVYANPDSATGLAAVFGSLLIEAWYPMTSAPVAYADIPLVIDQAKQASSLSLVLPSGPSLAVRSPLPKVLSQVQSQVTSLTALLALAASAPLGMTLAVILLGIRTVIRRRQAAIMLASARGMRAIRIRGSMALQGLVIALPASGIASIAAALVIPGPVDLITPIITIVAVAAAFAVLTSPSGPREERADLSSAPSPRRRVISEAIIVGLTALAVFLLSSRGLLASSATVGVDPLLAATPLLLALTVCVIVLRLFPYPLLWLQRRMRSRRGPIGILGAARAVRDPALGFASVLAIIIGVSAAVFSLVMVTTVSNGLDAASRESVGGDLRVESPSLTTGDIEAIRAVPGVGEVTPAQLLRGSALDDGGRLSGVTVFLADTESLHMANPAVLDLTGGSGGTISVVVSDDIRQENPSGLTLNGQKIVIAASVDAASLPVAPTEWVLVDSSYATQVSGAEFAPQQLFITLAAGANSANVSHAIEELIPADSVVASTDLVAEASVRPSIIGMTIALLAGAILSLLLCGLTVVLSSVAAAASRARAVGVMRLLGMPASRSRALVAWELGPVTVTSVVAGTALGLALPFLVTTLVDLRNFVGGVAAVEPIVPVAMVAAVTCGFALVVLLVGAIASASGIRSSLATTARIGAE